MITKKDIEHLAQLARMNVSEREKKELAGDLQEILEYVAVLKKADAGEREAFISFPHLTRSNLRDDIREDVNETEEANRSEKLMAAAPKTEKGYVKVKQVLDR